MRLKHRVSLVHILWRDKNANIFRRKTITLGMFPEQLGLLQPKSKQILNRL